MKKTKATARTKRGATKKPMAAAKSEQKNAAQPKKNQNPADDEGALHDLFTDLLKDIYWTEKMLVRKLPEVQESATSEALKKAIGEHYEVTRKQVQK